MATRLGVAPLMLLAAFAGISCAEQDRADIEVLYAPSAAAPLDAVTVTLTGAGIDRELNGAELGTTRYATPHSPRIELAPGEELTVGFRIEGAAIMAEGAVRIPIEPGRRYGASAGIQAERPVCLGCVELLAFPLTGEAANGTDSLFISWGSNSISNPVDY